MASESGAIAAYLGRSLERKKKAELTERGQVNQKDTSGPQGRQRTPQNAVRTTPTKGGVYVSLISSYVTSFHPKLVRAAIGRSRGKPGCFVAATTQFAEIATNYSTLVSGEANDLGSEVLTSTCTCTFSATRRLRRY